MIDGVVYAVLASVITAIISAAANVYVTQRVLSHQLATLSERVGQINQTAEKAHDRIDRLIEVRS